MNSIILLKLIIAHLLSDFIFQTDNNAKHKDNKGFRSKHLYYHTIITFFTASLLVCRKEWILPILIISIIHGLTDGCKGELTKRKYKSSPPAFLFFIDQAIHLLFILVIFIITNKNNSQIYLFISNLSINRSLWTYMLAYISLSIPCSILISKLTQNWNNEISIENKSGLSNAGKWIGIIERFLIVTFVLINQFSAIGFILAAKSVFRFGDLKDNKDQKKTEYIIIGTFLSFLISIIIGLIAKKIVS